LKERQFIIRIRYLLLDKIIARLLGQLSLLIRIQILMGSDNAKRLCDLNPKLKLKIIIKTRKGIRINF